MQATVPVLWLMPALQLLLLLFFTSVAVSHWIYNWLLLAPCLMTGTAQPYSTSLFCCCGMQDSSTCCPAQFLSEFSMQCQATYHPVCHLVLKATHKLAKTSPVDAML